MKRYGLIAMAALVIGCTSAQPNNPAPSAPATAAPSVDAPATQPAAVAAAPAAAPTPFDLSKDDKVYIFGSIDDMMAFQNGKDQAFKLEKPNFTADGKTVVVEAVDEPSAEQLLAGYVKQHPDVKK